MLVLHHYADIPVDRVAQILEIPVGTVYSRLHHAMRAMRAALDADERLAATGGFPMTTEHDPRTRIVLSWLHEDAHENAERYSCAPSTRWTRRHSAGPGGRRGGSPP